MAWLSFIELDKTVVHAISLVSLLRLWFSLSAFSKTSLNIRKFTVHILLKPGLENFEHLLACEMSAVVQLPYVK